MQPGIHAQWQPDEKNVLGSLSLIHYQTFDGLEISLSREPFLSKDLKYQLISGHRKRSTFIAFPVPVYELRILKMGSHLNAGSLLNSLLTKINFLNQKSSVAFLVPSIDLKKNWKPFFDVESIVLKKNQKRLPHNYYLLTWMNPQPIPEIKNSKKLVSFLLSMWSEAFEKTSLGSKVHFQILNRPDFLKSLRSLGFPEVNESGCVDSIISSDFCSGEDCQFSLAPLLEPPYEQIGLIKWPDGIAYLGIWPPVTFVRFQQLTDFKDLSVTQNMNQVDFLTLICSPFEMDQKLAQVRILFQAFEKLTQAPLSIFSFYPYQDYPDQWTMTPRQDIQNAFHFYHRLQKEWNLINVASKTRFGILNGRPKESRTQSPMKKVSSLEEKYFSFDIEKVIRVLGEGNFGCTVLAEIRDFEASPSVIKILLPKTKEDQLEIDHELELLDLLSSRELPHIPTFIGAMEMDSLAGLPLKEMKKVCANRYQEWQEEKNHSFYFLAMSAATGGSLSTFIEESQNPQYRLHIPSVMFQLVFTLAYFEDLFGFIHYDLSYNNVMFITQEKLVYWRYRLKFQEWIVPIQQIVQLIDFGASFSHKDLVPISKGGTPTFRHPREFLCRAHLPQVTTDWFAMGKHLWNLTTDSLDDFLEEISETDDHYAQFIEKYYRNPKNPESKDDLIEGINQVVFLCLLHPQIGFPKKQLHSLPWNNNGQILMKDAQFLTLLKYLLKTYQADFAKQKRRIHDRIGATGYQLIQTLCQWNYTNLSPMSLLNHPFFQPFRSTQKSFAIVKTIS